MQHLHLGWFFIHWHFQNLEAVLLILRATTSAPFIPALYHLTHHVLIDKGGKKNIPVSNKSEIHQGPQSVHSPSSVQIVLHSAAQQMHFVPQTPMDLSTFVHFRRVGADSIALEFWKILTKSCTIDFQARRGKNCFTIVVSDQNFNIVKGLLKVFYDTNLA